MNHQEQVNHDKHPDESKTRTKLTKVLASCSLVFKDKGLIIILSIPGHCFTHERPPF